MPQSTPTPSNPALTGQQAIPITLAHIQAGHKYSAHCCPVARALSDAYPNHDLHVTAGRILMLAAGVTYLFQNAQSLQTWILVFDDTGLQRPAVLILDFDTRTALVQSLSCKEGSLQP